MAKDMKHNSVEFSRIVKASEITSKPFRISIKAEPAECQALAERFGFESISELSASFTLRWASSIISLEGQVKAKGSAKIGEGIVEFFIDESVNEEFTTKDDEKAQELHGPELIQDDIIDIGEIAAQYVYLGAEDHLSDMTDSKEHKEEKPSPFSKLKDLL